MAYLHSRAESYPADHEFTNDELSAITPTDIIRWMNVKLYEKEHPGEGDEPVHGSHHTLDYYKKSISYFMPNSKYTSKLNLSLAVTFTFDTSPLPTHT